MRPPGNPGFVSKKENRVHDRTLQLALREWRQSITSPRTLVVLVAIAFVLAMAGAFGTDERLRLLPRLFYWGAIVGLTFTVGSVISSLVLNTTRGRLGYWIETALTSLMVGLGATAAVLAINFVVFAYVPDLTDLPAFLLPITAIAAIITFTFRVFEQPGQTQDATPRTPALLARLPLDKRGALVALSSEDHYVRVQTTQGEELVLLRLSDAIREAAPTAGLHVHRSHWVAVNAVQSARRDGDRAVLSMTHGPDIPVSRANLALIKDAGLLAR